MDSSEIEEIVPEGAPDAEPLPRRSRPADKADNKPRFRHTAQEISEGKMHTAQLKLDDVKEAEGRSLSQQQAHG